MTILKNAMLNILSSLEEATNPQKFCLALNNYILQ